MPVVKNLLKIKMGLIEPELRINLVEYYLQIHCFLKLFMLKKK